MLGLPVSSHRWKFVSVLKAFCIILEFFSVIIVKFMEQHHFIYLRMFIFGFFKSFYRNEGTPITTRRHHIIADKKEYKKNQWFRLKVAFRSDFIEFFIFFFNW